MIFPESIIAHEWIDPVDTIECRGVEFGAASHNPFGFINCIYADREIPKIGTPYYIEQTRMSGSIEKIDVFATLGENLPFNDASFDYIITSHVLEHVWDLISCFHEMKRILKPNGLMVHIIPHMERIPDEGTTPTAWDELIMRNNNKHLNPCCDVHHSAFNTQSFLKIIKNFNWIRVVEVLDVDDKVGNGFLVVMQYKATPNSIKIFNFLAKKIKVML